MSSLTKRASLLAAAGALTVGTLAACSNTSDDSMRGMDHNATPMSSGTSSATTGSSSDAARQGDVMFAQMMIPHHEQAIEMADIALSKSSASSEVDALATEIKKAQDPEITTMREWLTSWGAPTSAPTGMDHGSGMMSETDMEELKSAEGKSFDQMWITMMISHHKGAVSMAEQVLTTTENPEVEQMAKAIIKAQKSEIATMEDLL